jgi:phosphotransferase system HPr (HPr) family protein
MRGAARNAAESTVEIKDQHDLHARTATMMAKVAIRFLSTITIGDSKARMNTRSAVGLVSLGARIGARLQIKAVGA